MWVRVPPDAIKQARHTEAILILSLDFETRSTIALPDTGPYVYAMHDTTDIWLAAWALDDMKEPELWFPGMVLPSRFVEHVESGGEIRAHNAQFERLMWKYVATARYGWPEAKLEQFVCSAAEAAAMSLPRSLGQLAAVLGVEAQKDSEGYNLMMRMCRPRSVRNDGTLVWWDVPERVARLGEYCKSDVKAERACTPKLARLNAREREVYLFDQRVNDRGFQIDTVLIGASKEIANEGVRLANAELSALTNGEVSEVTKIGLLKTWMSSQGFPVESLDKAAITELLSGDLPPKVRAALELRAVAGRSSIAKLDSMLECACTDGRVRGSLLYHGAGTGRWSGRLVQPHNFPRGEIPDVESYIDDILDLNYAAVDVFYPPVVVISSLLRAMITAAPGKELIAADFSAIEARVLNWLAGQADILELFASGEDVYKHNAARLYKIPLADVQKFPHRQTGKFQELGCGFGMGHKKAVSAAKDVYQLEIDEVTAKEIVDSYRATHTEVVDFWGAANNAVIEAVENPGLPVKFGALRNLTAVKAGSYLFIGLPNKRPLCYPSPKIVERKTPWGEMRPAVEFWGVNPITRQWTEQQLYGGLIVENVVQAVARDLMAEGMMRGEERGYPAILSVHDEVVAEVPEGFGSVKEYEGILSELPDWARGCPVAAEGWKGFRYRK